MKFEHFYSGENTCTRNGDIRIIGLNSSCIIAGRMDLCYNLEWRAVCHGEWDINEAMVVCELFGFPANGQSRT